MKFSKEISMIKHKGYIEQDFIRAQLIILPLENRKNAYNSLPDLQMTSSDFLFSLTSYLIYLRQIK